MGLELIDLARAGIKERRDPNIGRHARSVGTVLVEMAQGRLYRWREFDGLEKNIRCGFRLARSYKELINEQNVRIFIVPSCIGAVPIASL
jgi:hypothetical protein